MITKHNKTIHESINGLVVGFSTCQKIIDILKVKNYRIIIEDDDNIYESMEEVIEVKGIRPTSLTFKAKNNQGLEEEFVSINFMIGEVVVYGSVEITSYVIRLLMLDKQRYYPLVKQYYLLLLAAFWLITGVLFDPENMVLLMTLTIICSLLIVAALFFYRININWFRLDLQKEDKSNFFIRNKDQILLLIISSVLSYGLGLLTVLIAN